MRSLGSMDNALRYKHARKVPLYTFPPRHTNPGDWLQKQTTTSRANAAVESYWERKEVRYFLSKRLSSLSRQVWFMMASRQTDHWLPDTTHERGAFSRAEPYDISIDAAHTLVLLRGSGLLVTRCDFVLSLTQTQMTADCIVRTSSASATCRLNWSIP